MYQSAHSFLFPIKIIHQARDKYTNSFFCRLLQKKLDNALFVFDLVSTNQKKAKLKRLMLHTKGRNLKERTKFTLLKTERASERDIFPVLPLDSISSCVKTFLIILLTTFCFLPLLKSRKTEPKERFYFFEVNDTHRKVEISLLLYV